MDGQSRQIPCRICDRPAVGFKYGVLACEGCKTFFKRATQRKSPYLCYVGWNCPTDARVRARCKACRFRKCAVMGMKAVSTVTTRREDHTPDCTLQKSTVTSSDGRTTTLPDRTRSILVEENRSEGSIWNPWRHSSSPDHAVPEFTSATPRFAETTDPVDLWNEAGWKYSLYSGRITLEPNIVLCTELKREERQSGFEPNINVLHVDGKRTYRRHFSEWSPEAESLESHPVVRPCQTVVYDSNLQIATTFYAVGSAVWAVFGDQIAAWTKRLNQAAKHGHLEYTSPVASVDEVRNAFRNHAADSVGRIVRFASMLPGTSALDLSILQTCIGPGWKKLVFFTIHHSIFLTPEESHITIGPDEFPLSRQWLIAIFTQPVPPVMNEFIATFREIGLNEVERYLLLVVVMLELDDEHLIGEVRELHRHYTRVLLDLLKWRCTDEVELTAICKKLECFFCAFEMVDRLYRQCSGKLLRPPASPIK